MPSPFPGMDPYAEAPTCWPSVHYRLPGLIADHLQPQLAPRDVAVAEERVYLEEPAEEIIPNVYIRRGPEPSGRSDEDRSTVATTERQSTTILPVWIEAPEPVEAREYYVEIRALPGQQLVTVIELLSPSNKRSDGRGRARYLRKQRRLLQSDVNLVEIDLLRGGAWTVALPKRAVGVAQRSNYRVCVRRAARPGGFEFYPIRLPDALPTIRIPLRQKDEDPELDLAAVFAEAYDRSMVATRIDYTAEPEPPLSEADARWAADLLSAAGRR